MAALSAVAASFSPGARLYGSSVPMGSCTARFFSLAPPSVLHTAFPRRPALVHRGHPHLAVRSASSSPPDFVKLVQETSTGSPVVVFSKSWCPYCSQVKGLFKNLGVDANVVELDNFVEEQEIQEALYSLTGQRTVPNVFIGGQHIGGCDDTMALNRKGELSKLLEGAGVTPSA